MTSPPEGSGDQLPEVAGDRLEVAAVVAGLRDAADFYSARNCINEQRYTPNAVEISRRECLEIAVRERDAALLLESLQARVAELEREAVMLAFHATDGAVAALKQADALQARCERLEKVAEAANEVRTNGAWSHGEWTGWWEITREVYETLCDALDANALAQAGKEST